MVDSTADGDRIPFYVDEGDGDPLVLLHSGGMAHQEFEPHLEAFQREFRVLAPDLPGHGRTPLPDEGLTVAGLVEAIERVLDDAGIETAHALGSSMGGAAALRFALEHPSRVDRLVCFRTGHRASSKQVRDELGLADPDRWRRMGMDTWLSRVHEPQGGPDAWTEVIQRAATLPERDAGGHDLDGEALAQLEAPTLIAVGDRDPIVPLDEAVEMYRTIPDADLWVIPRATHVVAARSWRKETFQAEVTRFLKGSRRPIGAPR